LELGSIASIIRTNLEEVKPSWKKLSKEQRESWFDMFKVIKFQTLNKGFYIFIGNVSNNWFSFVII